MYCAKCGNKIGEDAKFCGKCGEPISDGQPSGLDKKERQSKNIRIIALAVVIVLIVFGGIKLLTKSPENRLVGTWICTTDEEWSLTFSDDGTYYDSDSYFLDYNSVGTWKIPSDGVLYLKGVGNNDTWDYELKGNVLTIYVKNSRVSSYSFKRSK